MIYETRIPTNIPSLAELVRFAKHHYGLTPRDRLQTLYGKLRTNNKIEAERRMLKIFNETGGRENQARYKTIRQQQAKNRREARDFIRNLDNPFESVNQRVSRIKLFRKALKRKIFRKRSNINPVATTHGIYTKYDIPSYDSWIQDKMKKLVEKIGGQDGTNYIEMNSKDVSIYAKEILKYSTRFVGKALKDLRNIKAYVVINLKCFNTQINKEMTVQFNLGSVILTSFDEFESYIKEGFQKALNSIKERIYLIPYGIGIIEVSLIKYNPLTGSSYTALPISIYNTKSIINIKNTDQKCFLYSLIASRHMPLRDAERVKQYQKQEYLDEFIYKETDFPMSINKIPLFEKRNNIKINVYSVEKDGKTKFPLKRNNEEFNEDGSKKQRGEIVNLFYYNNHYSLIKSWGRFSGDTNTHICPNCFWKCSSATSYDNHLVKCIELNKSGCLVKMPEDKIVETKSGKTITIEPQTYYKSYSKEKDVPVYIVGDFENALVPHTDSKIKGVVSIHKPISYRLRIVSKIDLGDFDLDYEYTGNDCEVHFMNTLINVIEPHIKEIFKSYNETYCYEGYDPIQCKEEQFDYHLQKDCMYCKKSFNNKEMCLEEMDYCKFTGKYTGRCCEYCNKVANPKTHNIPVIFHNSNYDIKCFIKAFQTITQDDVLVKKIGGIPCNIEMFKTLQINSFHFIDSLAHLNSSLDKLIKNLPDSRKTLLRTLAKNQEEFELINKKGFYPYEMITSIEKLDIPITELKQHHFDNRLQLNEISDRDFKHVQKVIKTFGFTTFKQYHDLYLKIDVFGLTDVFEYHRELTKQTYGLDPAHFIGLPQLTWTAGLKFTGIKLDDIKDQEMYLMFEMMKRGGVSVISHKFAKANNKYLPDYEESKESSYLIQLDCNNLYGHSMCEKLPTGNFKWVDVNRISEAFIDYYDAEKSDKGYILEVDLDYPNVLHDLHNDYPLAPEHLIINGMKKLAPNFNSKTEYVLHISNLKYYLSKGMILKKVHRVISFSHSNWLKPYIENNSKLRQKEGNNEFEKTFYKDMNNAFYGKTMENVKDRVDIKFCIDNKQFKKNLESPLFANQVSIIKEGGLALVKMTKRTVELNKPLYIGACVLDFSKLLMYKFHYDTMKVKYPNALMMKTDTDSLLYYIHTEDLYMDFKDADIQKQIEFSNYPKSHHLYNCDRKKMIGIFQDECVGDSFDEETGLKHTYMTVISKYVGLRSKSYVNQIYNTVLHTYDDKKKSKGVPSKHTNKKLDYDDFKGCVDTEQNVILGVGDINQKEKHKNPIYMFRSRKMVMYSVEMSKVALSSKDDKRIPIPENKYLTRAIGHFRNV